MIFCSHVPPRSGYTEVCSQALRTPIIRVRPVIMMLMSALRTYTRMCLCIWTLGRAPREKCFGQTSLKRYWESTTLRPSKRTRGSHLGGLVYKYTLVVQVLPTQSVRVKYYRQSKLQPRWQRTLEQSSCFYGLGTPIHPQSTITSNSKEKC